MNLFMSYNLNLSGYTIAEGDVVIVRVLINNFYANKYL